KPEGLITEGYVAKEALTFSSHYVQDVTTKFNPPDRNVDCPPPMCQFQIRQCHIDKDPGVSAGTELFALAYGPKQTPISVKSYVVNGVRFVVHSRDECHTTQNNDICSSGDKDGEMYYGQLEEILEFSYMSFKVVLFRVKWFDTSNEGRKVKRFVIRNNVTQIWANGKSFKDDQYILTTQVKQVFYLKDMARRPPNWKVVEDVNHKKFLNGVVIVVEDDHDVIHFDNSSDLALSTSLNDLDFTTLHIDGQSMYVDAPPDIIDVDEDDDIIDKEDALPYDLAYSNDEDLVNVDDDDDVVLSKIYSIGINTKGHGGDDRPPSHQIDGGCRGNGTRKPNLGDRKAGRLNTHKETRNLGLRRVTDLHGPQGDRQGVPDALPFLAQHPGGRRRGSWERLGCRAPTLKNTRRPSLIHTYFDTHTVDGIFLLDEERILYEEMLRLQGLGSNTSTGIPYTDDEIMTIVGGGKSDDKMSQLLTQFQSQPEVGSGSGSEGAGDDELGDDEDADEDEEDKDSYENDI
ncbi:reverse transcriptase domain-containing protein, partial [Tanacetum coccineum]